MIVIIIITASSSKVPDLQANSINGQSISASPHRMQQVALTAAPPRRANTSARSLSPPGLKPLLMPLQGCIQTADILAVTAQGAIVRPSGKIDGGSYIVDCRDGGIKTY